MFFRFVLENFPRHIQILMKVVAGPLAG